MAIQDFHSAGLEVDQEHGEELGDSLVLIGQGQVDELRGNPNKIPPETIGDHLWLNKARPALVDGINLALDHYAAAKQYILAIPRRNLRLRLAALWPVVIGLGTLAQLADNRQWLSPDSISKVTRGWIYKVLLFSMLVGRSNRVLTWWIRRLRKGVESAL